MDIRKIKKLIEMLQESDLKEIEVSQGDESVRILRDRFVQTNGNKIIQQPEVFSAEPEIQQKIETSKAEGNVITSPIVANLLWEPTRTLIHINFLAPLLSADFNVVCICIITFIQLVFN